MFNSQEKRTKPGETGALHESNLSLSLSDDDNAPTEDTISQVGNDIRNDKWKYSNTEDANTYNHQSDKVINDEYVDEDFKTGVAHQAPPSHQNEYHRNDKEHETTSYLLEESQQIQSSEKLPYHKYPEKKESEYESELILEGGNLAYETIRKKNPDPKEQIERKHNYHEQKYGTVIYEPPYHESTTEKHNPYEYPIYSDNRFRKEGDETPFKVSIDISARPRGHKANEHSASSYDRQPEYDSYREDGHRSNVNEHNRFNLRHQKPNYQHESHNIKTDHRQDNEQKYGYEHTNQRRANSHYESQKNQRYGPSSFEDEQAYEFDQPVQHQKEERNRYGYENGGYESSEDFEHGHQSFGLEEPGQKHHYQNQEDDSHSSHGVLANLEQRYHGYHQDNVEYPKHHQEVKQETFVYRKDHEVNSPLGSHHHGYDNQNVGMKHKHYRDDGYTTKVPDIYTEIPYGLNTYVRKERHPVSHPQTSDTYTEDPYKVNPHSYAHSQNQEGEKSHGIADYYQPQNHSPYEMSYDKNIPHRNKYQTKQMHSSHHMIQQEYGQPKPSDYSAQDPNLKYDHQGHQTGYQAPEYPAYMSHPERPNHPQSNGGHRQNPYQVEQHGMYEQDHHIPTRFESHADRPYQVEAHEVPYKVEAHEVPYTPSNGNRNYYSNTNIQKFYYKDAISHQQPSIPHKQESYPIPHQAGYHGESVYFPQDQPQKSHSLYDFRYDDINIYCMGFPDGTLIGDTRKDCKSYFTCKHGQAIQLACPKGKSLDARYGACTKSQDTRCTNKPIIPAIRQQNSQSLRSERKHYSQSTYQQPSFLRF